VLGRREVRKTRKREKRERKKSSSIEEKMCYNDSFTQLPTLANSHANILFYFLVTVQLKKNVSNFFTYKRLNFMHCRT
jgi:hypothetical protein